MINSASTESERSEVGWALQSRPGKGTAASVALISLLLLVPCVWQTRIQANDLSSHIYNAWLVSLAIQGRTPGLYVVRQWNNTAFDLALEWLLVHVGSSAAQRITVSLAVLIFAWGAIALVTIASGKNWWFTVPCIAILAYGFIYHMGFSNYYLSMGICFWYLALVWNGGWKRRFKAAPLLLFAWVAQPLPVVWAVGMALYVGFAQKTEYPKRIWLITSGVLLLFGVRQILMRYFSCSWSWKQIYFVTGANQSVVFSPVYAFILALLLLVWFMTFRRLVKERGMLALTTSLSFQLWLLNAMAVLLLPNRIDFPEYGLPFSYVTDRLSLGAGIMACTLLAAAPSRLHEKIVLALAAAAFFGLIFVDTWKLNRLEDCIDRLVAQLPPGGRVLGYFPTRTGRISPSLHALDRACIGHCFSYGNYEPSSRQFRLRAQPGNPFVFDEFRDADAVQTGTYVVRARDLPVYLVHLCGNMRDHVCLRPLRAGDVTGQ